MIASELIADNIPPLKTSDTVQKVLERLAEFRLNHLPIVNEEQFLGLIAEDDLIEVSDHQTAIGAISLSLVNPYVFENQHIYDVIRLFYEQNLTVVPVLDHQNNYLGIISIHYIMGYLAKLTAVSEPGGIIILEINNRDNSLAHIAQIVESENAQILSSYTEYIDHSTKMRITLKLNKVDVSQVLASFLRYQYTVLATFNHIENKDGLSSRFDSLMNYLSF